MEKIFMNVRKDSSRYVELLTANSQVSGNNDTETISRLLLEVALLKGYALEGYSDKMFIEDISDSLRIENGVYDEHKKIIYI